MMLQQEGGDIVGLAGLGTHPGDGANSSTNTPSFRETREKLIRATDPKTRAVVGQPEVQLGLQMEALELRVPSEDERITSVASRIPLSPPACRNTLETGVRFRSLPPHRSPSLASNRHDLPRGAAPRVPMRGRHAGEQEKGAIHAQAVCSASSSIPAQQREVDDATIASANRSSRANSVERGFVSPCRADSLASPVSSFFDPIYAHNASLRSRETTNHLPSVGRTTEYTGFTCPPDGTLLEQSDNDQHRRRTAQSHSRPNFRPTEKHAEHSRRHTGETQHQLAADILPAFGEMVMPVKRVGCESKGSRSASGCLWWRASRWVDALSTFCRFSLTFTLVSGAVGAILVFGYYLIGDIQHRAKQRQTKAAAEAAACRQQHVDNGCDSLDPIPPYLRGPCEEWRLCLLAVPDDHGETTKVAAQVVAQVLNSFFQTLHWRTLVAFGAFLWLAVYAYRTFNSAYTAVHTSHARRNPGDNCHPGCSLQGQGYAPVVRSEISKTDEESRITFFRLSTLLDNLELEQQLLRNQLAYGQVAKEEVELSLANQRAISQQMAICLIRGQFQAERRMIQNPSQSRVPRAVQPVSGTGMWLSFFRSPLFKFLVLMWSVAACAIGCIYAIRHKLIQL